MLFAQVRRMIQEVLVGLGADHISPGETKFGPPTLGKVAGQRALGGH